MQHNTAPTPVTQQRAERAKRLLEAIERRDLDSVQLARPSLKTLTITGFHLLRVVRMSRFWEDANGRERLSTWSIAGDFAAGLSQQRAPVVYRVWCDGYSVHLGLGSTSEEGVATIESLLTGLYPGIGVIADSAEPSPRLWSHVGAVSGIPVRRRTGLKESPDTLRDVNRIDRLLRGLPVDQWCLLILAEPISREVRLESTRSLYNAAAQSSSVATTDASWNNWLPESHERLYYPRDYYLELLSELASAMRRQQSNFDPTAGDPLERIDRVAQRNVEILEREIERAECAKRRGLWDVQVYFGAPNRVTFLRLQALLHASFASDDEETQSLRLHQTVPGGQPAEQAKTTLTSEELASYLSLPREEFRGYQVVAHSRYGITSPVITPNEPVLTVGPIIDGARPAGHDFQLNLRQMNRHALIAGTTGSGKTNTCLYLLHQLARYRVPFFVVEPVNARLNEYRSLLNLAEFNQPDYHLRVFTLGDESTSPCPLNPLEIVPGDTVDAHISRLMTCFKAAIPMWQPLPAVFLAALQRTYAKAGLLPGQRVKPGHLFPSLHDFAAELTYVAEHEVEHSGEAKQNILGASTLRMRALLTGSAGRTLNARFSIPLEDLVRYPTIIELRHIGDDSDKALVIAFLLMRLIAAQEHGFVPVGPGGLSHVLLIEEAHRLLGNYQAGTSEDQENTRGEAAQTFAQLLAETRKYGQCVVIAEQMPEKLVRDAIGNTGLKIVHGLASQEDRAALAAAMRLNDQQREAMASLQPGEAVVYVQGEESAARVSVPHVQDHEKHNDSANASTSLPKDTDVWRHMQSLRQKYLPLGLPFRGCDLCKAQCKHRGLGEAVSRLNEARTAVLTCLAEQERTGEELLRDLIGIVYSYSQLPGITSIDLEMSYCVAIHLMYQTQGVNVDSLELWRAVRQYLETNNVQN